MVINETAKSFFRSWDTAIQEPKQYMQQNLFLGDTMPSVFIEQLKCMNKFLKYFPRADTSLAEDKILIEEEQLITIMHHALHGTMQLQIQRSWKTINEFQTLDALKVFLTNSMNATCWKNACCTMMTTRRARKEERGSKPQKVEEKRQ
jgi:hypothetical protein